jgi:hypothetical protein
VLQQPSGYTTKANVDVTGTGAGASAPVTAANLNVGKLAASVITFKTSTATLAVTIGASFASGAGTATVNTLDQLNSVLASNGITVNASVSATADTVTFTSTNDAASQTITTAGTAPVGAGVDIKGTTTATAGTVNPAVADAVSQATRAGLVTQYNQIIQQITTTAQDASFNGINLLNGDSLKLVFDETGHSSSTITGVTFDPAGLGLKALTAGTDFLDNGSTNSVLSALNTASVQLRSQASAFGANLSIVQIRQDFNKNIINVLQTGSANLTLADSNEEAANSRCRPASRSRRPRSRWLTRHSRTSCSCCADFSEALGYNKTAGLRSRRFFFVVLKLANFATSFSWPFFTGTGISGAAAGRPAATGWRAKARISRSTAGSTAPGCWPLPRWNRPASSWPIPSATR